jgi:hypothetical protein
MANVEKLSVTLSKDVLAWARKRARTQGVSLSALLSEIVARRLGRDPEGKGTSAPR